MKLSDKLMMYAKMQQSIQAFDVDYKSLGKEAKDLEQELQTAKDYGARANDQYKDAEVKIVQAFIDGKRFAFEHALALIKRQTAQQAIIALYKALNDLTQV